MNFKQTKMVFEGKRKIGTIKQKLVPISISSCCFLLLTVVNLFSISLTWVRNKMSSYLILKILNYIWIRTPYLQHPPAFNLFSFSKFKFDFLYLSQRKIDPTLFFRSEVRSLHWPSSFALSLCTSSSRRLISRVLTKQFYSHWIKPSLNFQNSLSLLHFTASINLFDVWN